MKRSRLSRVVVTLAVIVVAGAQMLPGQAFGTAVLTGGSVTVACDELLDPSCSSSTPPAMNLTSLTYDARVASANLVVFEYVPAFGDSVCSPAEGPGQCQTVQTGFDRFAFTEGFADITTQGLCGNAGPRIATCAASGGSDYSPASVAPSLPVTIRTKALNDQITAVIPLSAQEYTFSIEAGSGNDVITLVDNAGRYYGGVDRISCGDGSDRVTTTTDAYVAPDCETVTRLT